MKETRRILLVALALCGLWTGVRTWLPRPELAETNYSANRLRVERYLHEPVPDNVIVGTSIAGRLLPSYFKGSDLHSIANLGLDGATPGTGLDVILGLDEAPKRVFLEVHRLTIPSGPNDTQLLNLTQGFGAGVGHWVPLTRAESRPSTVLYGWLKGRQSGGSPAPKQELEKVNGNLEGPIPNWVNGIREKIQRIQKRGSEVVLIALPVGRENPEDGKTVEVALEAAKWLGLPLMDLNRLTQEGHEAILYTDGLHLSSLSAERVAKALIRESGKEESRPKGGG